MRCGKEIALTDDDLVNFPIIQYQLGEQMCELHGNQQLGYIIDISTPAGELPAICVGCLLRNVLDICPLGTQEGIVWPVPSPADEDSGSMDGASPEFVSDDDLALADSTQGSDDDVPLVNPRPPQS